MRGSMPSASPTPADAALRIRLFVMDVDGTLTDGTITYAEDGTESKSFHARDGAGIKMLALAGVVPAIVSGRTSAPTVRRAKELGIADVHQGVEDKAHTVRGIRERMGIEEAEVAFMGDDLSDLAAMRAAGFSAAPADADPEVRRVASYVCRLPGGRGAVREAIEALLRAQGKWDGLLRRLGADGTTAEEA
jgi:3-deoxy-D-manno-octulosonate 8-phosphate phosphatase (KDO 8-P phosphatase)